jgi:uncharacterized protein
MKCPNCKNVNLMMADRQGIETDYCPEGRGIWLDRGELDKLTQRSTSQSVPSTDRDAYHNRSLNNDMEDHHNKKHKRKFLLGTFLIFRG